MPSSSGRAFTVSQTGKEHREGASQVRVVVRTVYYLETIMYLKKKGREYMIFIQLREDIKFDLEARVCLTPKATSHKGKNFIDSTYMVSPNHVD